MNSKLKSRKFWLAVTSALLLVANEGLGLDIPEDVVLPFVALIVTYILGEAAVDATRNLKE